MRDRFLGHLREMGVGTGVFAITLLFLLVVSQWGVITSLVRLDILSWQQKVVFVWQSLTMYWSVSPLYVNMGMILIAVFSGFNAGLFVKLFRQRRAESRVGVGSSAAALAVGALGVGCSSCGSVFLVSIFGLSAVSPLIAILPFKGFEFSIVSIILLIFATVGGVRELRKTVGVCQISQKRKS